MSDLETLRTHAKQMAEHGRHGKNCGMKPVGGLGCTEMADHAAHEWQDAVWPDRTRRCGGRCRGCITDAERALWRQIADEVGSYLDQPADDAQESLI